MSWITFIGLFAATCTTISFLPQALKTVKTKNTKDLSLGMYAILVTGIGAWLVYGILMKDIPLIAANAISFLLAGWVLMLKIKYG